MIPYEIRPMEQNYGAMAYSQQKEENAKLQKGFKTHGDRILTALDNCMHEYGEDDAGQAAQEWIRVALEAAPRAEAVS